MWYLPDRYKIETAGIPRSTFNFDAHVTRLLPLKYSNFTKVQTGTRILPNNWLRPYVGLAYAPIIDTSFSELALCFSRLYTLIVAR